MYNQTGFTNPIKNSAGSNGAVPVQQTNKGNVVTMTAGASNKRAEGSFLPYNVANIIPVRTRLYLDSEKQKYIAIVNALTQSEEYSISKQDNVPVASKVEALLRCGKLLNNSSNDGSTTLDNLYNILKTPRTCGFDNVKILSQAVDAIFNPTTITQNFGDIPENIKNEILKHGGISENIKANPDLLDVDGSGTCVSASVEFHMANKHPAEFARWVSGLTSVNQEVEQRVKLDALSKNKMDAITFLNLFDVKTKSFDYDSTVLSLKPDDGAYVRAQLQNSCWDYGERTIIDALMQATLMQLGSQESYDSLTDIRGGKFSTNPQGLVETEKTFIESIVENNERLSVRYQQVDDNQNLVGWECGLDKIQKHILQTLNAGEDVIIGYVLTNETSGRTKDKGYVNTAENSPNKIVCGHEITIVGYEYDEDGKLHFVCNDTDDDKSALVKYSADYLLPKIHHAAYPVDVVENDLKEIEARQNAAIAA